MLLSVRLRDGQCCNWSSCVVIFFACVYNVTTTRYSLTNTQTSWAKEDEMKKSTPECNTEWYSMVCTKPRHYFKVLRNIVKPPPK